MNAEIICTTVKSGGKSTNAYGIANTLIRINWIMIEFGFFSSESTDRPNKPWIYLAKTFIKCPNTVPFKITNNYLLD